MLVNEQAKIKGIWKIQVKRAVTEEIIREQKLENVVTDNGKTLVAQLFNRGHNATGSNWVMAVLVLGTGNGTPSSTDTNLWSPVDNSEKQCQITQSGNVVQYYVRYLPEDANGYTYTEGGIYDGINRSSGDNLSPPYYTHGVLLNHVLIDPPIEKTSDILVDIYVQIQFA